jgi:hypothetical protein
VEYRLAPEWKHPTQMDEFEAVIEWLRGQDGEQRGVDASKIVAGSDSAGSVVYCKALVEHLGFTQLTGNVEEI